MGMEGLSYSQFCYHAKYMFLKIITMFKIMQQKPQMLNIQNFINDTSEKNSNFIKIAA